MDTTFSSKLGALFNPKNTFLVIFPTISILNLKKHQIWLPWVMTKILMCHMPDLKRKNFGTFSQWVYFTLLSGGEFRKNFLLPSKFCFLGHQQSSYQEKYYKNWHFLAIEKCLCPPCATVRVSRTIIAGPVLLSRVDTNGCDQYRDPGLRWLQRGYHGQTCGHWC